MKPNVILINCDDLGYGDLGCYGSQINDFLEAIRIRNYKLHVGRKPEAGRKEGSEWNGYLLYDLENDVSETENLYDKCPEKAKELMDRCDWYRDMLGDACIDVQGKEVRQSLRIENPVALTQYDENHPYIIALYDKGDAG